MISITRISLLSARTCVYLSACMCVSMSRRRVAWHRPVFPRRGTDSVCSSESAAECLAGAGDSTPTAGPSSPTRRPTFSVCSWPDLLQMMTTTVSVNSSPQDRQDLQRRQRPTAGEVWAGTARPECGSAAAWPACREDRASESDDAAPLAWKEVDAELTTESSLTASDIHTYNHNRFTAPFPGPPGRAGARRELLDFMVQGKINRGRHTDHPAGRQSIRTNQCPPPPSPPYFLQAGCPSCRPANSVKAMKAT